MFDTKNGLTDKLKRFAITFAVLVAVQLVLAGPAATAAWWGASADLISNGSARMSSFVDAIGTSADSLGTAVSPPSQ